MDPDVKAALIEFIEETVKSLPQREALVAFVEALPTYPDWDTIATSVFKEWLKYPGKHCSCNIVEWNKFIESRKT